MEDTSDRRETGWSPYPLQAVRILREVLRSTRGPAGPDLWCTSCRASGIAG